MAKDERAVLVEIDDAMIDMEMHYNRVQLMVGDMLIRFFGQTELAKPDNAYMLNREFTANAVRCDIAEAELACLRDGLNQLKTAMNELSILRSAAVSAA